MTALVGISGWAGAGKDTLGNLLAARGYATIAFADPMRQAAIAIDPVVAVDSMTGDFLHYAELTQEYGYTMDVLA